MTDEVLQKLSAYMDGECSDMDAHSVVERVSTDEATRAVWTRYHLIGDAMRGELPRYTSVDFPAWLRTALTDEPHVLSRPRRRTEWRRPAAALAIAASVAMVAVIGVQKLGTTSPPDTIKSTQLAAAPQAPAAAVTQPVPVVMPAQVTGWPEFETSPVTVTPLPPSRTRLNSYLVNYSEERGVLGGPGVLPYVIVAGYGQEP